MDMPSVSQHAIGDAVLFNPHHRQQHHRSYGPYHFCWLQAGGQAGCRLTGWLPIHQRSQASLEDETTSKLRLTSEIETLKQQLAVQQQQIEAANAEAAAAKANAAAETKAKAAAEAKAAAAFRSSPEGQKVLPARLEMQRGDADVHGYAIGHAHGSSGAAFLYGQRLGVIQP